MRYVFFDIECAVVTKEVAKICAFGYVRTDEAFHILDKEDILINPRGSFRLTDSKGQKGLVLPYAYDRFGSCPSFDCVYPRLRSLLEEEDTLVFGHAVMNDVKYLCLETKRYALPSFRFSFADTQQIYMVRTEQFEKQLGLEAIMRELNVEFTPHRAVDDAYATMKVAEAMCIEENCTLKELLEKYEVTPGTVADGTYVMSVARRQRDFNEERRRRKEEREAKRSVFYDLVNRKRFKNLKNAKGALAGKTFKFSRRLEEDPDAACPLLEAIYAAGGRYVVRMSECEFLVVQEGDETSPRTDLAIVYPKEVMEMIG